MKCPICANEQFQLNEILTKRLIEEWELNANEVTYINMQQGLQCTKCFCNLRSMTLADAIMKHYGYQGQFQQFCHSRFSRKIQILEINDAGNIHNSLNRFKHYTFAEYPLVDIHQLPYESNSFDCIVHSDTLEHVKDSKLALRECWRVLKSDGALFYTIPIIYGRLTRRRDSLSNSYHGKQDESQGEDFKVITEYGADFWVELTNAGFNEFTVNTLKRNASIAICAKKNKINDYKKNDMLFYINKSFQIIKRALYI